MSIDTFSMAYALPYNARYNQASMASKKYSNRGFAAMDPEQRIAVAKKGGHAVRKKTEPKEDKLTPAARGFAAMDVEKRKEIAKRGGSTSRRNRIDWKEQAVIL